MLGNVAGLKTPVAQLTGEGTDALAAFPTKLINHLSQLIAPQHTRQRLCPCAVLLAAVRPVMSMDTEHLGSPVIPQVLRG